MTTVKTKLQAILEQITEFENWVGSLDAELTLEHYYIHMPSLVIPYSIVVRRKSDDQNVAVFDVNYDDVIMPMAFTQSIEQEILSLMGQPGMDQELEELYRIRHKFGLQKYLVLGNPAPIIGNNGDILTIYMDYFGRHSDLYLKARIAISTDYIFVKVDQNILMRYLYDTIVLQDVLTTPAENFFYYQTSTGNLIRVDGISSQNMNGYCVLHNNQRISQLGNIAIPASIQHTISMYNYYRREDPLGEENWALGNLPVSLTIEN